MAIAKNPKRNQIAGTDQEAEAFILGAGQPAPEENNQNKKPIMVRVDPDLLQRIDRAAKRLGISRSAFMVSSTAEKLERME
ncbi:MAG: ribbon-helix-helix protein, CopG family [Abitibacteriaceae bacterium]|nr:ribbon-helix-helix protein, CopG family [Abditibacteriaceae bacterium]